MFHRYHRRRDELDGAIGEMFVKGVSTAKVGEVIETLTGSHPSASTVSRVFHTLEDASTSNGNTTQLAERYAYAFADGTYFSVIYNGEGCKMPILAVVGISTTGEREVLAFRVGDRENQQAWEDLLDDVKARGVKEIGVWVTDGGQAMLGAISSQICELPRDNAVLMHKMENVLELRASQATGADRTRAKSLVLSEQVGRRRIRQ